MRYGYDELLTQIYRSQYDCFSIGRSHMGREILAIKLGSGKTPLIVVGAHHGREFIASQYIMGAAARGYNALRNSNAEPRWSGAVFYGGCSLEGERARGRLEQELSLPFL